VEIRDADDLSEVTDIDRPAVLALAVYVGTTRLIDNTILTPVKEG
jgi:pantoate--beta-alanine ligase